MKNVLKNSKTIVIKLGTNVVMEKDKFNSGLIGDLALNISEMQKSGKKFIIITSGAIGMGKKRLNVSGKKLKVELQQACASAGQSLLMHEYEKIFSKFKIPISQVLLAQENFEKKESLENLKKTIHELHKRNAIPIINENDAVAIEELSLKKHFSDNDVLSALVAKNLNANLLLILTNVEGIYSHDPGIKNAKLIEEVRDACSLKIFAGKKSSNGRGGIETKILAAKIATKSGAKTIVCRGKKGILKELLEGKKRGTIFY